MDSNDYLNSIQQQVENEMLAKEQIYSQIRETGEEAPAKILSMMDTGVRVGDGASMLKFSLEVFAKGRPSFRAETQTTVSDPSRPKFVPGATIYVKFNPSDITQVAVDHAPTTAPQATAVTCPSCSAELGGWAKHMQLLRQAAVDRSFFHSHITNCDTCPSG